MDVPGFTAALVALVTRLDPRVGAAAAAAIAEAMPRLLAPDGDDEPGSLSRADLYRIRAVKLIASQLPPGALASPALRRALRGEIRALVGELLGEALPPSPYLDRRDPPA